MTARPRLSQIDLWGQQIAACLSVLVDALRALELDPEVEREDDINRALFFCINEATHRHMQAPQVVAVGAVAYEGRNSPSASDAERAERESKRPDFAWAWIDHLATDPTRARRELVLECKRLAPANGSWRFTRNYIAEGVCRFVSPSHGYGKDMRSAMMLGYLQQMSVSKAIGEVNATALALGIPVLEIRTPGDLTPARLDHLLDRSFAESPFRLDHVWVDVNDQC